MADHYELYVDGRWTPSDTDEVAVVDDPSTGERFATVAVASERQVDAAVAAARGAFDEGPWPRMTTAERCDRLDDFAHRVRGDAERLAEITIREVGSPRRETLSGQIMRPVGNFAASVAYAREAGAETLSTEGMPFAGASIVHREAVGVCVSIPAFNYPINISLAHLGPSLAAGNTVVVKPSPLAPIAALSLATHAEAAGLPAGVLSIVNGDPTIGRQLVSHPLTDLVAFTGSTAVGRAIMADAAPRLKRLLLELGGKSPSVVLSDGDLDLATRTTLSSVLRNAGQNCVAISRLLVPQDRLDETVELAATLADRVIVGTASDPRTEVGPLITETAVASIEAALCEASAQGARVITGGQRVDVAGHRQYLRPTVVVDPAGDTVAAVEELFGPVLTIIPYRDTDDALRIANSTPYGLAASVWGTDRERATQFAGRLLAGTVWVNVWGVVGPRAPFGGVKQSGVGRLYGASGLASFTDQKHIFEATDTDQVARAYARACSAW